MQADHLNSPPIDFALLTDQDFFKERFKDTAVRIVLTTFNTAHIFAIDLKTENLKQKLSDPDFVKMCSKSKKMIYITDETNCVLPGLLELRMPDLIINPEQMQLSCYLQLNEELQQHEQDQVYLSLAKELNSEYEKIKTNLEKKISDNQKNLIESRQKILEANNRSEALRKILYSLHQESDVARIETLLNELLPSASSATWVKIVQSNLQTNFENDLKKQLNLSHQSYDLNYYQIYFIKGDQKSFKKGDLELFQKIRDALVLNLTRNQNLSDLVLAEKILTEAFETFPYPLALIDSDYNVLNSNQTFLKNSATKCYQMLFNSDIPCNGCHLGKKFHVEKNGKTFEVTSNVILPRAQHEYESQKKTVWVHTYKDRTEEVYLEQRITQNEKMKDLGLISSSIAHELNNPLGGIISYLQILQMEISKESDLQSDLKDMLQASFKMKKIIEDLLVFSRRPQTQNQSVEILSSILKESLSENEIIFRAENLKIVHALNAMDWNFKLSKMMFKDSIYFIFQFFLERARRIRVSKQNFTGLVEIKFFQDSLKRTLRFVGNFGPLENNYKLKNVQFLAIHKTLIDQGLHVELTELDQTWVAIDIIFQL
jgi:two-component system NtrC family sensor kinase